MNHSCMNAAHLVQIELAIECGYLSQLHNDVCYCNKYKQPPLKGICMGVSTWKDNTDRQGGYLTNHQSIEVRQPSSNTDQVLIFFLFNCFLGERFLTPLSLSITCSFCLLKSSLVLHSIVLCSHTFRDKEGGKGKDMMESQKLSLSSHIYPNPTK
jgi:hypothetical protein